jgi:hypothetical protein
MEKQNLNRKPEYSPTQIIPAKTCQGYSRKTILPVN